MLGKGPREVSRFFILNQVTAERQALVFGWGCHGCCSGGRSQVRCESSGVREAVPGWLQACARVSPPASTVPGTALVAGGGSAAALRSWKAFCCTMFVSRTVPQRINSVKRFAFNLVIKLSKK